MKKQDIENISKNIGHVIGLWLPLRIKYAKVPGLSIGIAHQGKLLYQDHFGYADVEKKKKVDENTLYHIASISKTFTSVAIMQLVEKEQLRLDDKVSKYLDWFKGKKGNNDSQNITIRQILSHNAGLFRDGDTPHWETGKFPTDLKRSFSPTSLVKENSTGFKYTNYGYSLLGLIIKEVTGLSYEEYVQKNILDPLRIKSTHPDYSKGIKNIATGYGREIPDQERKTFNHYKTNAYAPATGFISNVANLAKFADTFSLDSKDSLISREARKELMRSHDKTEEGEEYGLGLDIFYIGDKKIVGHSGGFNGFITQFLVEPQSGLSVVVLTNSIRSPGPGIARGIMGALLSGLENSSKHKGKLPNYSKYEGTYRNSWGDNVVAQFGKDLWSFSPEMNLPAKYASNLKPLKEKDTFVVKNNSVFGINDETAQFSDFKNGKAQKVISGTMPGKRVKI